MVLPLRNGQSVEVVALHDDGRVSAIGTPAA